MSKRKLITSLVAMILLVAMTVASLVSCSGGGDLSDITDPGTTIEKPAPEEPEEDPLSPRVPGELELETVEECQEIMVRYLGEASVTAAGSIIKHVEAIVYPDDAPNKAVEWSIAWADGASRASEPVENYVKVYTTTPGSTYATVECVKAFTGDEAIITVTTKKGGFKASIKCSFIGYPDSFDFNRGGLGKAVTDSKWNKTIIEYDCGSTYNITFDLNNGVGVVGEQFNNWQIDNFHAYGAITIDTVIKDASGTVTSSYQETQEVLLQQTGRTWLAHMNVGTTCHLLHAEIVNGVLILEFPHSPTAFHSFGANPNGSGTRTFASFVDNKPIYFDITVKEATSGLTKTINVRGITTTTGVSLNDGNAVVF